MAYKKDPRKDDEGKTKEKKKGEKADEQRGWWWVESEIQNQFARVK